MHTYMQRGPIMIPNMQAGKRKAAVEERPGEEAELSISIISARSCNDIRSVHHICAAWPSHFMKLGTGRFKMHVLAATCDDGTITTKRNGIECSDHESVRDGHHGLVDYSRS